MGIGLRQQWRAALDGKTRHTHRLLDGQMVDIGEKFKVDGYELEYPGDPSAPGYLVYNCRCTVVSVDKFHDPKAPRVAENPLTGKAEIIQGMTYTKHKAENPEAWELYQKKSQNLASDKKQYAEFKDVLGGSAPKSLDAFQSIKYNDPERWAELKVQKRQTKFVNNAPCETTPKKYYGYFLNPEAKHSIDFSTSATRGIIRCNCDMIWRKALTYPRQSKEQPEATAQRHSIYTWNLAFLKNVHSLLDGLKTNRIQRQGS